MYNEFERGLAVAEKRVKRGLFVVAVVAVVALTVSLF